ncbi:MAG TPA: DUF3592 domain-containing protein [Acidobacteriaceae bacterium]|jgi:hypothetical protein|nr:DUF3592 domain-containing protein [Acidobacteriaceae bacterium]
MTHFITQNSAIIGSSLAALVVLVALLVWLIVRRRKSPEEIERLRREYLVRHGRIIDGTVLDLTDALNPGDPRILQYQYEIAGVIYECGQDVTHLLTHIPMDSYYLGMPASVRYDTQNPGNSIIVAEAWNGLYNRLPPATIVSGDDKSTHASTAANETSDIRMPSQ